MSINADDLTRFYSMVLSEIGSKSEGEANKIIKICSDPKSSMKDIKEVLPEIVEIYKSDWLEYQTPLRFLASTVAIQQKNADLTQKDSSGDFLSAYANWWASPGWFYYGPGYGYHTHHVGGVVVSTYPPSYGYSPVALGGGADGETALIVLGITLLIICAPIIIYGMCEATKNIYKQVNEMCTELANNQRVLANMACLCLVAVAAAGIIALLATNPVGWGIIGATITAVALYCVFSAALSCTRAMTNRIDAKLNGPGDAPFDSRFQLTKKEELAIRGTMFGCSPEAKTAKINMIKRHIQLLDEKLASRKVTPNEATKQLAALKKGNVTLTLGRVEDYKQQLKAQQNKKRSGSPDSSNEGKFHGKSRM